MLTEYTTYAEVRSALGVSEEELSDEELGLDIYLLTLEDRLESLSDDLLPTWQDLPEDPDSHSAEEKKFAGLFKLYSTYAVAFHLLDSAELFGFLKVADGRASTERVPDSYKNLRINVTGMLGRLQAKLLAALGILVPGADVPVPATLSFVSAVGIAVDPVTNV